MNIKRLKKVAEKATQGDWFSYNGKLRPQFGTVINEVISASEGKAIVQWSGFDNSNFSNKQQKDNCKYIATFCPPVVLGLIAEIERLQYLLNKDKESL